MLCISWARMLTVSDSVMHETHVKIFCFPEPNMSEDEVSHLSSVCFRSWMHASAPSRRFGAPDASVDDVRAAADQAFATQFINDFPDGFDTVVGCVIMYKSLRCKFRERVVPLHISCGFESVFAWLSERCTTCVEPSPIVRMRGHKHRERVPR